MDWLLENWFWIVIAVVFVLVHTKMHGGHGGCGRGHGGPGHGHDDPPMGEGGGKGAEH